MGFVRAICTEQLFNLLELPLSLKTSEKLNPMGRELIHDPAARSALIPHPFHHSDYPDRGLSFYLRGKHFNACECVKRSDGPDRVEVWCDEINEQACREVTKMLEGAIAVFHNQPFCSLPIVVRGSQLSQTRLPRPASKIIPKLNTFCTDLAQLNASTFPSLEELTIQSVMSTVLLPEELETLEKHLATFGWSELSPQARDLIQKVFDRTKQQRQN